MRNLKKFLALVLSLIMAAGTMAICASAVVFEDVPTSNQTLAKAVDLLSSVGITTGTTATSYGTSEGVTRQQMATFIYRLMKAGKTVEGKEGDNITTFTDLNDPFYYFMISWANDMGIIKGRNATTFDPEGGIILQDAYVMLTRALGYEKQHPLDYPFDYINVAEKIGLDEGLSAKVNYDTSLTRGDVAILLYNAFYANMATGEIAYDVEYEIVDLPDGKQGVVEKGMEPYTIYDTVAEKIFGIKKTIQRVVATPNYRLNDNEKTDDKSSEDGEVITVECLNNDYKDTDDGLFRDLQFNTLGLSGKADDYFLFDLSIYYKKEENKVPEIISVSSIGTRKESVPGNKIQFETDSNFAYQDDGSMSGASGKVTIDGTVSYLYNAPWSYSRPKNMADKDKDCMALLYLAPSERDPEDEDYVLDFNFETDKDVLGRGAETYRDYKPNLYDRRITGSWTGDWTERQKNKVTETMGESDSRGGGVYSMGAMASVMQIHFNSTNFEADAWDSNSDGKYDYIWLKPYTVGQIKEDEGELFTDMHSGEEKLLDTISAIYDAGEVPTIYSYGAVKEGTLFKDGQLFIGYINGPANYIKCYSATAMNYTPDQVYTKHTKGDIFSFNGVSANRNGLSRNFVGAPLANGARIDTSSDYKLAHILPYATSNGENVELGKSYEIVFVNNAIFHVKPTTGVIDESGDYAMILPTTIDGKYAFTESIGIVTDGKLKKSGNMLDALVGNEVKTISAKPQTNPNVEEYNMVEDGSYSLMPVTPKQANDVYDFSDYVGKLLTYTVNSDGEYVFKIAPLASYSDKDVLKSEEIDAYYSYQNPSDDLINTAAFIKASGNLYQFVRTGSTTLHSTLSPSRYVSFTYNTKVVIKTYDEEEDEDVYKVYTYSKKPNFHKNSELKNIKYIVKNNPNSTSNEELIYLYAEAVEGDTIVRPSSVPDYRFIKASKSVSDGEGGKIVYYDVYNPFTGTIEKEYETLSDEAVLTINGIYSLSDGFINDNNLLGTIEEPGNAATSETTLDTDDLGLVELGSYDKDHKLLETGDDMLYYVDDNTSITFLDLDKGTIQAMKNDSILTSTSATYRCNGNKEMPLLAFIASSEIDNEDDYEYAEVICIVRYNELG